MKRFVVCLLILSVPQLACQTTGSPTPEDSPAKESVTSEADPEEDLFRIPDDPFGHVERSTDALPNPITYTFGAVDPADDATTFRVYQDAGLTLMMPDDIEVSEFSTRVERNRFGNYEELFISGDGFGRHLVIPADRYYIQDDKGFEAGEVHEVATEDGTVEAVVDDFEVALERGERTRDIAGVPVREYRLNASYSVGGQAPQGGEPSVRRVEETSVLWIAEDRPYTPSYLPPLLDAERVFSSAPDETLGLHIYELAREDIANAGLVLGVDILDASDEPVFSVEASELVETQVTAYTPEPKVVTTAEHFMGMFALGMLQRRLKLDEVEVEEEDPRLSASLQGPVAETLSGTVLFGGPSEKPPMLVMVAMKEGAEPDTKTALMFAMVAEEKGPLEVGTYQLDLGRTSSGSDPEAAGQTHVLTSMGLVSTTRGEGSSTYPCLNAAKGELVIESVSDSELEGSFEFVCKTEGVGELTPVPREAKVQISGTFTAQRAPEGLWK